MESLRTLSRFSGYSPSWLAVIALLFVSGCSTQPEKRDHATQGYIHEQQQVPQNLPEVELDYELLYNILVATFAEDSGDLSLANKRYLQSAYSSRDPRLAKRATQIAIFAKEYGDALSAAQLWVELEPESLDARQSIASLWLLQGDLKQARPHLLWLLKQDNYSAKRLIVVATLMVRAPIEADVISLFEAMSPTADASAEQIEATLYATAILAQSRGENEIVFDRLEQLLKRNQQHAKGVLLRAKLWFAGNREKDAMESLASYLHENPDDLSIRLSYARMLVNKRNLTEGFKQFRELARQAPRDGDVIFGYGILAIQHNQLDIAEEQFQKLIQLKLREAEARQSLGQIFEIRNQTDEAINWYHSVPKGEHFFASQLRAAHLISKRDGVQSARDFLSQIPAADKAEEIQKLVTEAELLQGVQQYGEAFKLFSIALKEAPDNPDLLYAHAMAAEKIDRIDILEQDLTRVIKKDPDNIQALNALGYTLVDRTNRIAEAFEYIKRAYALDPEDAAILDSMGWALYRMGRHQEALEYLRSASKKQQDGEIFAHLGEVLWVSGDTDGARKIWNAALKLDPEHPVLKQTLERFAP